MLSKNSVVELTITDINNEGYGIGRHDSVAVFVPVAAIGDRLRVRIVKVLARYCFGIIEEILTPSPDRIEVDCPVYNQCGGCSLRHISYERECEIKNNWVVQSLRRIANVELDEIPMLPSPKVDGYRNKAQYPVQLTEDGLAIGFYARRSHKVISCKNCLLQPPIFEEILAALEKFLLTYNVPIYEEESHRGLLRHIYLRQGEQSGQIMLCLVINGIALPHSGQLIRTLTNAFPQITSVILNLNREKTNVILGKENVLLYGTEAITDTICGVQVELSPMAFYQVNQPAAQLLYQTAAQMANLTQEDILLDLYCGAGTIGLSMASQVGSLIGVEIVPQAVENARQNAKKAGIENTRFLCADAADAAAQLANEGLTPTVIVLDPPRKGCSPQVLEAIGQMAPQRVVYISCDCATLARDIVALAPLGYTVQAAKAVDLFPRTGHVETVCLLTRQ